MIHVCPRFYGIHIWNVKVTERKTLLMVERVEMIYSILKVRKQISEKLSRDFCVLGCR